MTEVRLCVVPVLLSRRPPRSVLFGDEAEAASFSLGLARPRDPKLKDREKPRNKARYTYSCVYMTHPTTPEMASVLSLTDDCLRRIVTYVDDPSTFYSFALTCQRFLQVVENTRSVLHTKLLRKKAEYFIKRYVVEIGDDYHKLRKLEGLLRDSARLTATKGTLTFDKLINVWQTSGPVAAKLFTWILNQKSKREEGEPRETCFTERRSVKLQLSCGKQMLIQTYFFRDYNGTYDPELSIHVTCGDLDVTSGGFTRYSPEDYMYWGKEEVRGAVEPMKEVVELLQKELGETVPPITDHFFIWLCYFFPDECNLHEEHRLRFKDDARNTKPTPASVQAAIDQFVKNQDVENRLQTLLSGWETGEDQESKNCKMIAETVRLLAQRSQAKVLERLQGDASRFYVIATDYDLKKLSKQLLLHLILRTSLDESDYSAASVADKCINNRVLFKCLGGKVLTVGGSMHGDGAGLPSWDEVRLQFTLPDGKVIELQAESSRYSRKIKKLEIEKLSPVTELLQEVISQNLQGEDCIPKIDNLLTADYFLHALEFSACSETFLGRFNKVIPSESEEELSVEESEDSEQLSAEESEDSEQ